VEAKARVVPALGQNNIKQTQTILSIFRCGQSGRRDPIYDGMQKRVNDTAL
jgi:hypothetical protein